MIFTHKTSVFYSKNPTNFSKKSPCSNISFLVPQINEIPLGKNQEIRLVVIMVQYSKWLTHDFYLVSNSQTYIPLTSQFHKILVLEILYQTVFELIIPIDFDVNTYLTSSDTE